MRAFTPPIRIATTETTTAVMVTAVPITVPMIHLASLLTLQSCYGGRDGDSIRGPRHA